MEITMRTLNKKLKDAKRSEVNEVTHYKGDYYLLHILKNGVPVPLIFSKDLKEIDQYIDRIIGEN
ncbi:MAG: hypothetical protein WC389_20435 [Lutibacter sp.]|jgi:hypothetical protein